MLFTLLVFWGGRSSSEWAVLTAQSLIGVVFFVYLAISISMLLSASLIESSLVLALYLFALVLTLWLQVWKPRQGKRWINDNSLLHTGIFFLYMLQYLLVTI